SDATVLCDHFERGGDLARALLAYKRAAEQALEGNDFDAAVRRAERGVGCGAEGETLGALRRIQAEAHRWRGGSSTSQRCAFEGMALSPPGGDVWGDAAADYASACIRLGRVSELVAMGETLCAMLRGGETGAGAIRAACRASVNALQGGRN